MFQLATKDLRARLLAESRLLGQRNHGKRHRGVHSPPTPELLSRPNRRRDRKGCGGQPGKLKGLAVRDHIHTMSENASLNLDPYP